MMLGDNRVAWAVNLTHSRALSTLHNPRYAGAFFYGRTREQVLPDGRRCYVKRPREEWIALFPDAHAGYSEAVAAG